MPHRDFLFAVHLADQFRCDDMLTDLAGQLLSRAGYANRDTADVVASMSAELDREAAGQAEGRRVEFSARDGQLQIVMSQTGGREWRLARPLP